MRQVDRYQIEAELDSGGFGTVFRARHVVLGRRVALKLLHPSRESALDVVERFLREARILSSIASPHVVQVVDAGMTEERQLFLAMELLDGMSLAARLEQQSPLTVHHALSITRQVAQGLAAAHAAGVVHRDLKPGNIFLAKTDGGREIAKVLDFGISKSQARDTGNFITMTGAVLGTPHYMAPEQLHGARDVDARADIYSLTVCLYEMLSGRLPYAANTLEALISQRLKDAPTPVTVHAPQLPFELVTIIDRGLAREPDARFFSIAEFDAALGRLDPLPMPASTPPLRPGLSPAARALQSPATAPTQRDPGGIPTANARGPSQRPPAQHPPPASDSAATAPAVAVTPWPASVAPAARPSPSAFPPASARPPSPAAFPPASARPSPSGFPPAAHSVPPAPSPPRTVSNFTLVLLLGGSVITILILIAALVSVTALIVARRPASPSPVTPAAPASPPVLAPTIGPMVPITETPPAPTTPEAAPTPTPPAPTVGERRPVQVLIDRAVGSVDTSTFDALFERATSRLNECRREVDDEVRLQVFPGPQGRLSIVQPDPTRPHGHEDTARCAAAAIRAAGPLDRESGHGIVQITVRLRAR